MMWRVCPWQFLWSWILHEINHGLRKTYPLSLKIGLCQLDVSFAQQDFDFNNVNNYLEHEGEEIFAYPIQNSSAGSSFSVHMLWRSTFVYGKFHLVISRKVNADRRLLAVLVEYTLFLYWISEFLYASEWCCDFLLSWEWIGMPSLIPPPDSLLVWMIVMESWRGYKIKREYRVIN